MGTDITYRLLERARIRRNATDRKSVQNGEPDRISDLLEEAAEEIINYREQLKFLDALEAAGVDNWDGYEFAMELYDEDT